MERLLLVALVVFPFVVLLWAAGPILPGTTVTFFGGLGAYGLWLLHARLRASRGDGRGVSAS